MRRAPPGRWPQDQPGGALGSLPEGATSAPDPEHPMTAPPTDAAAVG
ncbi:MAG: hypothetical protein JWO77_283, partial [Ilumatobacteraceae bacterium]|nr:hypothetical protein [Ilumatobacteraceae bacterium]